MSVSIVYDSQVNVKNIRYNEGMKPGRFYICVNAPSNIYIGGILVATFQQDIIYGQWINLSGFYGTATFSYDKFEFQELDVEIKILNPTLKVKPIHADTN